MIKDILKLVIAFWIIKHFVMDNDLLEKVIASLKDKVNKLMG